VGLAIDTILASAVNPGAAGAAALTTPSGDSLTVRSFSPTDKAYLDGFTRMGTTAGFAQVQSPLLHDAVTGIRITPAESPSVFSLPGLNGQDLNPQDTLVSLISGGAAETDIMALHLYYTNLAGASARLHSWGDIEGNVANIKPQRVAVTSAATIGAWSDTLIGTTENLLKANTDYAVIGYMTNTALAVIGIRGNETGNLRVCGPGSTQEFPTTSYFKYMSEKTGRPYVPVVNAANINNLFVSVAAATASVAAVVELILAQLSTNLTN
jgi:hypothetical protein